MQTKIQRWGNSLALRIPKSFAEEARVEAGSTVDLSIEDGELVIRPLRRQYSLRSLVAEINRDNVHEAIDTGEPVGRESW
ncbi:MAG TPA: AbrB/MazE/SpoVT family DNA-binding domain-containing protein [Actinomycetota bacterium]|nr:AbrB/MazE/SpoVT family DNA-binding domain-containing protein [Actinomycetota bacterium]